MEVVLRKLTKTSGIKLCIQSDCESTIVDNLAGYGKSIDYPLNGKENVLPELEALATINSEVRTYIVRRKGKKNFAAYSALPRCSFSPYFLVPVLNRIDSLKVVFLAVKSTNSKSGDESLPSAIAESRRVTERNIVKWVQQLFCTLNSLHKCYVTVGSFDAEDVTLRSSDGSIVDTFLSIEEKLAGVLERPRKSSDDDSSSVATGSISSKASGGDAEWEEFGRQAWLNLVDRPRGTISSFSQLKSMGSQFQCTIKSDNTQVVAPEVIFQSFVRMINCIHEDLRSLGVIALQLLSLRIFSAAEIKFWTYFHCDLVPLVSADLPMTSPEVKASTANPKIAGNQPFETDPLARFLFKSTNPADPLEGERKLQRLLDEVDGILGRYQSSLASWPPVFRRMVALCFLPRLPIRDEANKTRRLLVYPIWTVYNAIAKEAREVVMQYYEDAHYVKPSLWTEEDERKRIHDNEVRAQEKEVKARAGIVEARQRIRQAKYQVWWDLQSDVYKKRVAKQRKARLAAEKRRREEAILLRVALFHTWAAEDVQSWCHQALASFFHIVCYFAAHSAAQRPRQPEVYIAHLLQSLDSLLDAYLVSKVAEHYYDPQGPTNDRLTLASHPHLLHFNLDGDGHSLSNESNGVKSLGGRSSVDGSGDSSVTSRSSAGRGASSRGGILPGIRKRRAIPLSTSRSKVSNVSSSSSGSSANSSLLAANASPASPLIHLDSAPSVEEAAAPQSLTNARLVVPKSDREVVVMRLLAYHISKLIALHCPAASLYHLLTDALAVAGETVDQRVASHKAVYLSAQQWHFKKLRAQSAHLARNGAPLRQAVISFYTACEVIDRSRATAMVHFVGTALLHHFVCEDAVRRSGETVAAARLVAFFRMILVRAKWTALLRAAGVGSHMDDAKLKEARKWKSLLRKDPRMGSPILDRDGNGSLKSPSRPPSRPSRLSPLPTPPQTATPSSPSKSAPPVPAPSSSSSAKLAKLLPSPAQISAVVASVLNTSATIHLSFPASLSALGPAPSPAASPTRRDCGDDLFTNLCIRAYLLGPTDQAAEAIATNLTAQSAHPMVYLFIQSKSRAEVFNPFVLLNRQFAERFSPHCIELPCEFAPLGDAPAADEKLSTGTAAEMRRWQVVVSGLAPYQQYRLVLEMDADLMRGLLVPFRASLPRGSMVRDEEMVATLSPLPPYRPSAFNAQAYAFQLNIPMSTGGSVPSAPEKVVARRKYASALSPTLCAAMRQSVSTPTDASMPRYPLYYAFDTDIEDGGGFGVVSQFSALVWIAWPSSRADRRKPSRYTVQRRWLLWMDRPMCEEKGLSEKAVIWKRGEGTKPVEIVFAGKGAWSVCKEEVEGVIERPGEGTEMHEVGTNDYISSLSSPFDEEVPRRCTALIRHFYAFLVSKEYQVDTGLIDTGIRLGLQYRVKVHNSYGVGPFSGSHWQSVNSVIPFEDLGVCILSRVLVDRDDLISRGKYAAVPGRDVMSLIMSHGTISENTQDNEDLIDCN